MGSWQGGDAGVLVCVRRAAALRSPIHSCVSSRATGLQDWRMGGGQGFLSYSQPDTGGFKSPLSYTQ